MNVHAYVSGKAINKRIKNQLSTTDENIDSRELWACVRHLTGRKPNTQCVEGITADSLNDP